MEITEHIDALREQGTALAEAAGRAGLDAAVPPCPPWRVKDLLRHTGYIHRWAARHITECPPSVLDGPPEAEILQAGAPDPALLAWFKSGYAALAETLACADPDLECGTFMPAPSPLAFWARRQAHETAIHRADAESASGVRPDYTPEFAADGIDELIMGFGQRRRYRSSGPDADLWVQATDTGDAWYLSVADGRIKAHRQPRKPADQDTAPAVGSDAGPAATPAAATPAAAIPAAATPAAATLAASGLVSGPASSVYLFLWNRCAADAAGVTVTGDQGFLTAWQSSVRVRWG